MTFAKVCGITRPETLGACAGAHAVGFVVASPRSHRDLSLPDAAALIRLAGPFQVSVAVTAAQDGDALRRIVLDVRPHALQAPLRAGPEVFQALRKEFPLLRLFAACRPEEAPLAPPFLDALVLDAVGADGYGGKGEAPDWDAAREAARSARVPVLLAGGLTPGNVADAIARVRPSGVDVSSGVETDRAKDPAKIRAFLEAVRRAGP